MTPDDFSRWTSSLDPVDGAAFVAAAGILAADAALLAEGGGTEVARTREETLAWLLAPVRGTMGEQAVPLLEWIDPRPWLDEQSDVSPAALAAEFRSVVDSLHAFGARGPVVRIWLHTASPIEHIVAYLARLSDTGPAVVPSVSLPRVREEPIPVWRWPLFIAADGDLAGIVTEPNLDDWARELVDVVPARHRWATSSITLLSQPDGTAPVWVSAGRAAAFVVFTDAPAVDARSALPVESTTVAGAIAFVAPVDPIGFVHGLVAALAHDAPFDEAVWRAARDLGAPLPIVFAEDGFLRRARTRPAIGAVAVRLPSRSYAAAPEPPPSLIAPEPAGESAAPPAHRGEMAAPPPPADGLEAMAREDFLEPIIRGDFIHERHDATAAARAVRDVRGNVARREPRRVTGDVLDASGRSVVTVEPHAAYRFETWISPRAAMVVADVVFADDDLPWDGSDLRLDIVFTELRPDGVAAASSIKLPPTGDSTPAEFDFTTGATGSVFTARLAVLFRHRFVQTAILEVPVGGGPDDIRLHVETVVRPQTPDLAEIEPHAAAIVLNHHAGEVLATGISGDAVELSKPTGLDAAVAGIRTVLTRVVDDPDQYESSDTEAFGQLLVDLAKRGQNLHRVLFGGPRTAVGTTLAARLTDAERVSVLSAVPDTVLPLEFLYDRPLAITPQAPGALCANAGAVLADTMVCGATCPAQPDLVCPLGFWGLRKVIERHANPALSAGLDRDYAINPSPTLSRHKARLGRTVAAASSRVDLNPQQAWQESQARLADLLGADFSVAESWVALAAEAAGDPDPDVVVLLPHVARKDGESLLEIGDADQLGFFADFTPYLGDASDGPLVLLLGCATGAGDVPIEEFPGKLLDSGAKLVLATMTLVRGRLVAPLAADLVGALVELVEEEGEVTFGDALLRVRRKALVTNPMVLTMVAYGDADWTVVRGG